MNFDLAGSDGSGRSVHGPRRRPEATQAAGDHLRREAWQAQQWQDASPQGRKPQQKSCLPPDQKGVYIS